MYLRRVYLSLSLIIMHRYLCINFLSFLCLSIWLISPIYPDELAFRQHFSNFFNDGGFLFGLYALCASNIKAIPLILEPAAGILAITMQILPPKEMRVLSFVTLMAVVFIALNLIETNKNPAAGLIVLASFSGVAGSGLIFTRYEFALELHLLSCLAAAKWLNYRKKLLAGDFGCLLFLIFGASLSCLSHIQGILLLPLTAYFFVRISYRYLNKYALFSLFFLFGLLLPAALKVNHLVCSEYPVIQNFWQNMTLVYSDLKSFDIFSLMRIGYLKFLDSFLYVNHFPIDYLPEINVKTYLIEYSNIFIIVTLFTIAILSIAILIILPIEFKLYSFSRVFIGLESINITSFDFIILSLLIIMPMHFLFIYDAIHAFYRNFFINHFLSIATAISMSLCRGRITDLIVNVMGAIITLTACLSFFVNATIIFPKLWEGYEGPSLSVFHDWSRIDEDTKNLVGQCKMDYSRGRVVVDDLTQYSMRSSSMIFPVTYAILQSNLIGVSPNEALHRLHANYIVLRCKGFEALNLEPQGRSHEICCYNFSSN